MYRLKDIVFILAKVSKNIVNNMHFIFSVYIVLLLSGNLLFAIPFL